MELALSGGELEEEESLDAFFDASDQAFDVFRGC